MPSSSLPVLRSISLKYPIILANVCHLLRIPIRLVVLAMSFGCSATDIAAVGKLAWKVYYACKNCGAVFRVIENEASATHAVTARLEDEANDQQSMLNRCDQGKKEELMRLIGGLQGELKALDDIIVKYQRGRRIPNTINMARVDVSGFRAKLTFYFTAINAFTDGLARDALTRIEKMLRQGVQDIREGRRADPRQNASAWKGLEVGLAKKGISARDIARYRPAIMGFLLAGLNNKTAKNLSLHDVASAVRFQNKRAIRDVRASRHEETSSGEETSSDDETTTDGESLSDEEMSSKEESFRNQKKLRNEELFHNEESFRNEKSFSDEESYSDKEPYSDEVSTDEDAPVAKRLSNVLFRKATTLSKKALLFYTAQGF